MKSLIVLAILCVHVCYGMVHESETALCERSWTERFKYTNGMPSTAMTEDLRTNILHGKPVKVTITVGDQVETFNLDNLNMNGVVICGEAIDRMTSPIAPDAEEQPIIVCTTGHVSYLNSSVNRWDSNVVQTSWTVDEISFMTRDINPENNPLMTLYLDGSSTTDYGNYIEAAKKMELRGVMRDRGYTFIMENTHINHDTLHIDGQSLSHISQSYTPTGGITFRAQPYFWLSSWESTGLRDSARWTVGDVQSLKHTHDYVALQWYGDSCWTTVYSHDDQGKRLTGSMDMLKNYIRMGHRVRVHFDGYTLEANMVYMSPDGKVVAQTSVEMARRGGSGKDKTFFNSKTRRVYRLIHSNGLVRSLFYFMENGQLSAKQTGNFAVHWSVDTRPWNPVVSLNATQDAVFGSVEDLKATIKTDSVRVKLEIQERYNPKGLPNPEMYLEINNVRTQTFSAAKPDIVGQSIRTVPFFRTMDSTYYMKLYKPTRQYLEVGTASGLNAVHFDLATKEFVEFQDWPVKMTTWFTDGRL